MNVHLLDAGFAAAATAAWYGAFALARLITRPRGVHAAPSTPDLGAEPPAVVSLLAAGWEITEDAGEATLVDLAARGHLELRQPGDDPLQTTIHVREEPDTGLLPFEQQILDRVRQLAHGGVLPVSALTFRDQGQAQSWDKRLRGAIVAEARRLGLSQRRFPPALVAGLMVLAAGASVVIAWAVFHWLSLQPAEGGGDNTGGAVGAAIAAFLISLGVFSSAAAADQGERDTPAGREVAARWLGVRGWLRGHEAFADLPPSAVAVWDRYLSYGAALGVNRVVTGVLHLGLGDRKRVWSSFGGEWHRVRVRYPRLWPRYGKPTARLVRQGVVTLGIGVLLIWARGRVDVPYADDVLVAVGIPLALLGAYKLIRTMLDLAITRTFDAQVLWVERWTGTVLGKDDPDRSYLAVDDGSGDRTVAWARPSGLGGRPGDTVRVTVRPWSRRVVALTVLT
ncbi:MAG: DUF2207 domain-containing protein [Hamadaea sp.]|nr:DUF2207 domain-containing protein [Hamadaea sp.]NUR52335.1 DUF2207 domain-containing protein [Hamadaea sp.]NUT02120.1 DUF2207 domain-containing protein [Hamadaea sp.]